MLCYYLQQRSWHCYDLVSFLVCFFRHVCYLKMGSLRVVAGNNTKVVWSSSVYMFDVDTCCKHDMQLSDSDLA